MEGKVQNPKDHRSVDMIPMYGETVIIPAIPDFIRLWNNLQFFVMDTCSVSDSRSRKKLTKTRINIMYTNRGKTMHVC
jgi:hypothetical protein